MHGAAYLFLLVPQLRQEDQKQRDGVGELRAHEQRHKDGARTQLLQIEEPQQIVAGGHDELDDNRGDQKLALLPGDI